MTETGPEPRLSVIATPANREDFPGEPFELGPGVRVSLPKPGPPWLVVDHQIERIVVPRWPIRLWTVTDVVPAPPTAQILMWSTRAEALTVVAEVPAWPVLGEHGDKVAGLIERAELLSPEDAESLAGARPVGVDLVYEAAWRRWMHGALGVDTPDVRSESLLSTSSGSPVGPGLILAAANVERAARRVGDAQFRYDEVDGVDVLADPTWVAARSAVLEAALALGAPELMSLPERQTMLTAWTTRFGPA